MLFTHLVTLFLRSHGNMATRGKPHCSINTIEIKILKSNKKAFSLKHDKIFWEWAELHSVYQGVYFFNKKASIPTF